MGASFSYDLHKSLFRWQWKCRVSVPPVGLHYRQWHILINTVPNTAYIGNDYPIVLPVGPLDAVALTLQESFHFTLNSTDLITIDKEWETLTTNPSGLGRVHMGPDKRILTAVFLHQLHCVRQIQRAFIQREHHIATSEHIGHCFNYLRQTLLCDAAEILEKGDFLDRDFEEDRLGDTMVCKDWEKIYTILGDSFRETSRELRSKAIWDGRLSAHIQNSKLLGFVMYVSVGGASTHELKVW